MNKLKSLVMAGLGAVLFFGSIVPAQAQCKVSTSIRKFEGAERTIITMENDRIALEIAPDLEGRVISYRDKSRQDSPFECLDDCPYHYGCRWEGKPFTYKIVEKGPDKAVVTVSGSGKIAVAMMRYVTGNDVASPVELKVDRTMTIESGSTRLQVAVTFTNIGEGIAPKFRNMVHAVYGNIPPMKDGRAFWFLPTSNCVEFLDPARGNAEMWTVSSGAPVDHPFSRFTPGLKADKPRYEAGGWGAVLTSCGPAYIFYDAAKYDYMQYWFGGDAEWHFTFEPHSKAVDLKPGDSTTNIFTLAYDSKDVPFNTGTVAYERPQMPEMMAPGDDIQFKARATTAQAKDETVKVTFNVAGPKGESILSKSAEGMVKPFVFTELVAEGKLANDAVVGFYTWEIISADAKKLSSGKFEVVTVKELAKRKMEQATADLKKQLDEIRQKLGSKEKEFLQVTDLWRNDANMSLGLQDLTVWPPHLPMAPVSMSVKENAIPVMGLWKANELPRIKTLGRVAAMPLPANTETMLANLKDDRSLVRDIAVTPDGKGLVALICDQAKNRTEIVCLNETGIGKRFGKFSDKPGENDDAIGNNCRGLVVDLDGNIWVSTNAWGQTSVFKRGDDGAPYEATEIGAKGAVKKFSPDGKILGTVSMLIAPLDLLPALANGKPVIIAGYRHMSSYHGAQVREGAMVISADTVKRAGELKLPGGSISIDDTGRVWVADVAGHVACYTLSGKLVFDVKDTPAAAVIDAVLPVTSPLPMVLRAGSQGSVWALAVMHRKLLKVLFKVSEAN